MSSVLQHSLDRLERVGKLVRINETRIRQKWSFFDAQALIDSGKVSIDDLVLLDQKGLDGGVPTTIRDRVDLLHWLTIHGTDEMFDAITRFLTPDRFIGIDTKDLETLLHDNVILVLHRGLLGEHDLWKLHHGRDTTWARRSPSKRRSILQSLVLPIAHRPDSKAPGGYLLPFRLAFLPLTDACHRDLADVMVDATMPALIKKAPAPLITFADFMAKERACAGASYRNFSTTVDDADEFDRLRRLHIMDYNVNNATADEAVEATKWANRRDRVAALIRKVGASVVCLQELRNLPGNPSVEQFVAGIHETMRFDVAYRNSDPKAFAQVIMWDSTKLMQLQPSRQWISDTPSELSDSVTLPLGAPSTAYLVQGAQFVFVQNGKVVRDKYGNAHPFWVFNTHLGMDEGVKTRSCAVLARNIKDKVQDEPFFLCGDFNTFPDLDADIQREVLREHGLIDLGDANTAGLTVTNQGQAVMRGTFVGFERDDHKAAVPLETISRLDHVWASDARIKQQSVMTAWTNTMLDPEPVPELSYRDRLPSDHLPISTWVQIRSVDASAASAASAASSSASSSDMQDSVA